MYPATGGGSNSQYYTQYRRHHSQWTSSTSSLVGQQRERESTIGSYTNTRGTTSAVVPPLISNQHQLHTRTTVQGHRYIGMWTSSSSSSPARYIPSQYPSSYYPSSQGQDSGRARSILGRFDPDYMINSTFVQMLNQSEQLYIKAYEYYYGATGSLSTPAGLTHNGNQSNETDGVEKGYRRWILENGLLPPANNDGQDEDQLTNTTQSSHVVSINEEVAEEAPEEQDNGMAQGQGEPNKEDHDPLLFPTNKDRTTVQEPSAGKEQEVTAFPFPPTTMATTTPLIQADRDQERLINSSGKKMLPVAAPQVQVGSMPMSPSSAAGRSRKALDLRDPKTGKSVDLLHTEEDQPDSTSSGPRLRPTQEFFNAKPTGNKGSASAQQKQKMVSKTKDVGNEALEAFNGFPPVLELGSSHKVAYGFSKDEGCVVLIMNNPETDRSIGEWTTYYTNSKLDHLKICENLQNRMVMIFDGSSGTVTRGRLITDDGGAAKVYCVDEGKVATVPSTQLYLPTVKAIKPQWKNILCELDGLGYFLNSEMMENALIRCESHLEGVPLKITVEGFGQDKVPIVTLTIKGQDRTFNDILLQECLNQCSIQLPKKGVCMGDVVSVEEDGLVCFHLDHDKDNGPTATMDGYLSNFSLDDVQNRYPHVTPENVSPTEIYVSIFEDDGFFYRAKVLKTLQENTGRVAFVEFIDYGNTAKVPFEKLFLAKYLNPVLTQIPPLTCKAYLKWIQRFTNRDEISDELTEATWEIVVRHDMRDGLPMVCLQDENKENWNQTILKAGKAIKMK